MNDRERANDSSDPQWDRLTAVRAGPQLRLAVLRSADLRGIWLPAVNLTDADLSGAMLEGANLRKADLRGANLRGADLLACDLEGATLAGASLQEADCNFANLRTANLRGADLRGARIHDACFDRADLRTANMSGALLNGTSLRGANLEGADLRHAHLVRTELAGCNMSASFGGTSFVDVDLSEVSASLVRGTHQGPSAISTETLKRSKGHVPIEFLQGCGLTDWEIENVALYAPGLTPAKLSDILYRVHEMRFAGPIQFYSVFISHSSADRAFALALYGLLQQKGIRCWLDEKQLMPGDDIHDVIDHGIRHWDKVILCASKDALTSWWVDGEIERAFRKERELMKARGKKVGVLVPLDLDGFLRTGWENGKKAQLLSRHAADFTRWKSSDFSMRDAVEQLGRALRVDDAGREPPPPSKL